MAKRRPTGDDNSKSLDKNSYRIEDATGEQWRATCDDIAHSKLDALIAQDTPFVTYRSLLFPVGMVEIEIKSGALVLPGRRLVSIHNDSNSTLFYGPTGVTTGGPTKGEPLFTNQTAFITPADGLSVFIIAPQANKDIIVQEWS